MLQSLISSELALLFQRDSCHFACNTFLLACTSFPLAFDHQLVLSLLDFLLNPIVAVMAVIAIQMLSILAFLQAGIDWELSPPSCRRRNTLTIDAYINRKSLNRNVTV